MGVLGMFLYTMHGAIRGGRVLKPICIRPHTDEPVSILS